MTETTPGSSRVHFVRADDLGQVAVGDVDHLVVRDDSRLVLRVTAVALLAVRVGRAGVRRHDDPRRRAVDARLPRALLLTTVPCSLYVAVRSPKYQTVPVLSAAYQSVVFSSRIPSLYRTSWTTVVLTPWIILVHEVTVVRFSSRAPSSEPRRIETVPGSSGKYGFGCGFVKSLGSIAAAVVPAEAWIAPPASSPSPTSAAIAAAATVRLSISLLLASFVPFSGHGMPVQMRGA